MNIGFAGGEKFVFGFGEIDNLIVAVEKTAVRPSVEARVKFWESRQQCVIFRPVGAGEGRSPQKKLIVRY